MGSNKTFPVNSSRKCCSTERISSQKSFNISDNSQWLPITRFDYSVSSSETTSTSMSDTCSLKIRVSSSTSGSLGGMSRGSNSGTFVTDNGSRKQFGPGKRPSFLEDAKLELLENSQDPFAFDEDEFEPSKWDLLSGKQKTSQSRKIGVTYREEDGCQSQLLMSQQESSNDGNNHGHELSCLNAVDEEGSRLLADCLLTAVKVFH